MQAPHTPAMASILSCTYSLRARVESWEPNGLIVVSNGLAIDASLDMQLDPGFLFQFTLE